MPDSKPDSGHERHQGREIPTPISRDNSRLSRSFRGFSAAFQRPSIVNNSHTSYDFTSSEPNTEEKKEAEAKAEAAIKKTIISPHRKKTNAKLDLSNMRLTDLPDCIRDSHAKSINLNNNYLAGIPESLTDIINLTKLDLSQNRIEEIPEEFSKLVNLDTLDLSSNRLRALPEVISQLANLRSLNLNNNEIDMICGHIAKLNDLNHLSVANNNLRALAPDIGDMHHLKYLNLADNPDLKRIPPEWEALIINVLEQLNLKNTGLRELPYLERHPTSLRKLNLEDNRDMTTLPKTLGPMKLNRDPDIITTTKKAGHVNIYTRGTQLVSKLNRDPDKITPTQKSGPIDIYTKGSYLISGLASEGRLQIKHGNQTIPAGKNLPPSLEHQEGMDDSLDTQRLVGEPFTNDAPQQLALDPGAVRKQWEAIKETGGGPIDLIGLKHDVDIQNLVTIFAHTHGRLQQLWGADLNIEELNLALNVAMAKQYNLPLAAELNEVGAIQPLSEWQTNEAIAAIEHLKTLKDEQTNLAASQMVPLARLDVPLALTDIELYDKVNELNELAGIVTDDKSIQIVTVDRINQVFELAKGAFRQNLINLMSHIFVHSSGPYYSLDGAETSLVFQFLLAEKLGLPGNIGEVDLPPEMTDAVTLEEIQLIENTVLDLEQIDEGAIFRNYLESKPFWIKYVNELATKLIVTEKEIIDAEAHQIKSDKGWTPEYRKLGLGLFRQDRLNLVSHVEVYTREENQALDNPRVISLNYQIQLAEKLELPGVLKDFPKDVASVICWRIPEEKLQRVADAVLKYETLDDGQLFEEFLDAQSFWHEHLKEKAKMYSNQELFNTGVRVAQSLFKNLGVTFDPHLPRSHTATTLFDTYYFPQTPKS